MSAVHAGGFWKSYLIVAFLLQIPCSPSRKQSHILYCTVTARGSKVSGALWPPEGAKHPLPVKHARTAWQKPSVFLGMKISKFAWQQVMSAAPLVPTVTGGFSAAVTGFPLVREWPIDLCSKPLHMQATVLPPSNTFIHFQMIDSFFLPFSLGDL